MGLKVRFTLAALMLWGACQPALAYIDPGTGSILLQGIIGTVAGALVVAKIYWSKIVGLIPGMSQPNPRAESKEQE